MFNLPRQGVVLGGTALLLGTFLTAPTAARTANPDATSTAVLGASMATLTGPVAGAPTLGLANYPLSSVGYSESEFFFSGTAQSYRNTAPLGEDGNWSVEAAETAAYTSRMVVVRPQDAEDFSGTVMVEWLNVSGGTDTAPDWSLGHNDLMRHGDVYIGVSAQAVGVNAIKAANPDRYEPLTHPGDSFSYDIFSQAGEVVRSSASTVLSGLRPISIVAAGESQSARRLTTYVNAIAPLDDVFDAYLIHSRPSGSAALSQAPQEDIPTPAVVHHRDIGLPILTIQAETDVLRTGEPYYLARQPDSENFRLWEVAGTSHADTYMTLQALNDNTSWASDMQQFASMSNPPSAFKAGNFTVSCTVPFNTGQQHYAFQSAQRKLINWTRTGKAPKSVPRLALDTTTMPATYRVDDLGNVLGGVRTPAVDAPIARLSGLAPEGAPGFCLLFGQTHPFTPAQLSTLYPTQQDFRRKWLRAVERDLAAGFILKADARRLARLVA